MVAVGNTPAPSDPGERARQIALRLLTHAPRSSAQLREGLISRDVPAEVADCVIARYVEVGLLNDAELAATVARTRLRERGRSRRAIGQELMRKGFSSQDIESALAHISDTDEHDAAWELAHRRWEQLAHVDHQARVRRVVAMLGRRGYPPSFAFRLVKDLECADESGA